jgi:hypothetical protein
VNVLDFDPDWDLLMRFDVDYLLEVSNERIAAFVEEVERNGETKKGTT